MSSFTTQKLAQSIDHTLLRPDATEAEIIKICQEAKEYKFYTVCIEMKWLPVAVKELQGSAVLPITVISFPAGDLSTEEKSTACAKAIQLGAKEVDMVLNRGLLKAKNYHAAYEDILAVVKAAGKIPVKVILETSELTQSEKSIACALCKTAGAAFVKTSTGFSKSGATVEDVKLMRETVGDAVGVKASGGIRSYEDAVKMLEAGASRLGTSASIAIIQKSKSQTEGY